MLLPSTIKIFVKTCSFNNANHYFYLTVSKFGASLSEETRKDAKLIETEFRKFCKTAKNKEERFCYYLGGLEDSATGILGELSRPLKNFLPADKICEKIKKKDAQICDLRFGEFLFGHSNNMLSYYIIYNFRRSNRH